MAQSFKCPDFCSGHELTAHEIEPYVGLCADSKEPAWDSLSPLSLPLPHLHIDTSSLSQNKINKHWEKKRG